MRRMWGGRVKADDECHGAWARLEQAEKFCPAARHSRPLHTGHLALPSCHVEKPRLFPCHAEELRDEASFLRSGLNLPACRTSCPSPRHAEEPRDEASSPAYNRQQAKKILRFAQDDRGGASGQCYRAADRIPQGKQGAGYPGERAKETMRQAGRQGAKPVRVSCVPGRLAV